MATPNKKRSVQEKQEQLLQNNENSDLESSEDDSDGSDSKLTGEEKIEVEFEGRNPIDSDFPGIKQLLHQLFLKARINLGDLTDLIIRQNYVGSVIKQSYDADMDNEDDEDDDDNEGNGVFGVTTVVSLSENPTIECIGQLRGLLLNLAREHSTEEVVKFVENLLDNWNKPVGLLINERFVNIPAQITIPLFKSLSCELKNALSKKMPYDFSYFILICKLYKLDKKKGKKSKRTTDELIWSNPEEEIISQNSQNLFEFSVKNDADSGLSGKWSENDAEMTPYRRVIAFKAEDLGLIIESLEAGINQQL